MLIDSGQPSIELLFETSWEVCNKIGGIYTVLSTKAKTLQQQYKDKVIFIGPDVWDNVNVSPDFIPTGTLFKDWRKQAKLPDGITVRIGRWDVLGKPIAILVGFNGMYANKDYFYGQMWERYGVDSLHAYGDYDEGCAFALAAAMTIESILDFYSPKGNVVAHFDEWTTAMGLLYTKWKMPRVATVFTTHATCIGRSICGNGKPLYDYMKGYNGDQMAAELNMQSKHSLEKAAAHQADCFTTVSDVTADECAQLLEVRPQVVTPNGFEADFVPGPRKIAKERTEARARILDVAAALTGKNFTTSGTFIVATSGRCEYRNKGLDMFIDAVNALNNVKLPKKVLALILVPAWSQAPRADLAKRLSGKTRIPALPDSVVTHQLVEPWNDAVYSRLKALGIDNRGRTTVNVIYVPCYLNGNDGIFNLSYYNLLPGVDATVFPSYYEPWGYTPLESVAFGVPTVTTSLSGFGQWILRNFDAQFEECGVNVVGRTDSNYAEACDSITRSLHFLATQDDIQLSHIAKAAKATASKAAWHNFIAFYDEAYGLAVEKAAKRNNQ